MADKKGMNKTLWIIVGIVVLLSIYIIFSYNSFVGLGQNVNGKWSEVENQYQRQADLIPNIVSVVSSSVGAETKYVKDIVEARTKWAGATNQFEKDTAGVQMNNGIATLVSAVAEQYPTLQANKQYIALTDELSGTQNRITVARGRYIEAIQQYNTATQKFPANTIAKIFGFTNKEYYTANVNSMTTPKLGNGVLP